MSHALGRAFAVGLGCLVVGAAGQTFAAERVVFCEAKIEACAGATRLGEAPPRGWWGTMDDVPIIAAARAGKPVPPLLYESRVAYQQAITGLRGKDIQEAILQRLTQGRVDAVAVAPRWLFAAAYADMLDVIRAAGAGDQVIVDRVLGAAMALYGGEEPFQYLSASESISQARESLARLRVELKDGPVAAGYAREAQRLTTLFARFRPSEAQGGPFVAQTRAYFAPDQPPPEHVDGEVDPYVYGWHGGSVRVWMPSEHAEERSSKGKIRLMYFDREDFYQDMSSLTAAQMNLRLAARLKGPPAEELAALISRLALDHAVFMRQVTAVRTAKPPIPAEWAEAVALSTENLRLALRSNTSEPAPDLKTALAKLRSDVALLGVLAHASATPSPSAPLVDRFQVAVNRL